MMIGEEKACEIARNFSSELIQRFGDDIVAVYVVGSLAGGSYQPGRSDIDTIVIIRNQCSSEIRKRIREVANHYREMHAVPKDFGAVVMEERELWPPYEPERELVQEIIRLKQQGNKIWGNFDVSAIPTPTRTDFAAYAKIFYPWLRSNYIDQRPSEARTIDATVNTLLYELRLLNWHATSSYILDKREVIPNCLKEFSDPLLQNALKRIHSYVVEDEMLELDFVESILKEVSGYVRSKVSW